ncbi:hypothetical protein [Nocardiopsis synnemataformans]|uniref:hypothetical protein n=1 Tax=Nocardiopsis synnemataformans TaxID=61305 RepID=UPI003EBFFE9A
MDKHTSSFPRGEAALLLGAVATMAPGTWIAVTAPHNDWGIALIYLGVVMGVAQMVLYQRDVRWRRARREADRRLQGPGTPVSDSEQHG